MFPFDSSNISSVGFGVARDSSDGSAYRLVPVDQNVQGALTEMLFATVRQLVAPPDGSDMAHYEPSQKYASTESLMLRLDSPFCEGPRALYEAQNIPSDSAAIAEPSIIEHYFAVFHDTQGQKLLGVRRAVQFKGVVGARGRLVQMVRDTMQLLDDNVFRLDKEFDYLVSREKVYILHPSGFEYTADIDEHILSHALQSVAALHETVGCIDFNRLSQYVGSHKRAARLLASLRTRADIAQTSLERLTTLCNETNIDVTLVDGRIAPVPGKELDFLLLLDRRRYVLSLIDGIDEQYEAANRRNVG